MVDDMFNDINYKYGVMLECFYIVLNGKIVYLGERGFWGYYVEEVEEWLIKYML